MAEWVGIYIYIYIESGDDGNNKLLFSGLRRLVSYRFTEHFQAHSSPP